ncbi:hypothetical protein C6P40_000341 [Pichia californica]|uniref:BHLH domain-containing protein n=1 Tax=Pichia californica TaxID=460514 RepID=A0A9P6WKS4_9ASCO|nr:hypothetical protein C6P42_002317 [[Candida] californica]KAG0688941.1 hypothetical protein C6P40_000341 [[Candida] californica]
MLPSSAPLRIEPKNIKNEHSDDGIPEKSVTHVKLKNKKDKTGNSLINEKNSKINKDLNPKKGSVSFLTDEQKKANHILSETRRRNLIRSTYDKLVELVPQLDTSEKRAEHAVMTKTAAYIIELRQENERLEKLKLERGL